jgi:hypothetical protein
MLDREQDKLIFEAMPGQNALQTSQGYGVAAQPGGDISGDAGKAAAEEYAQTVYDAIVYSKDPSQVTPQDIQMVVYSWIEQQNVKDPQWIQRIQNDVPGSDPAKIVQGIESGLEEILLTKFQK